MFTSNNLDDSDLARLLQEEYDREAAVVLDDEDDETNSSLCSSTQSSFVGSYDKRKPFVSPRQSSLLPELSPVDPSLELSDPTPDIILLFLDFNERYFWGSLSGIEVKWSPRMTLCAGLCVYEGRGGLCSVRLSLPLLKLRPRKDLVETLLHEMIHAYLFVTNNDRDHSGHGPNFLSHMNRLNKATGASISVYHTFNDEVDSYQQHWWRCNGPCQQRAPYFGYVKRSMNRAPSAKDFWWPEHQATCGGIYTKIKEPEGYGQKKPGKGKGKEGTGNAVEPPKDIRAFWGNGHTLSSNTGGNSKTPGASQFERKPATNSVNRPKFSSGAGPSSTTTGQPSVNGTMSKPSYDLKSVSALTKTASNPSTDGRREVSPSLSFKQPIENNRKYPHSTASRETETSFFSTSSVSDIRKDLSSISSSLPTKRKTSAGDNKNSFSSGRMQRNSPHLHNKKMLFPKNFVSVCDAGDSKGPTVSRKKKKKKYIMDELDSNDGLWDETIDRHADVNSDELSNESSSMGKINKLGSGDSLDNNYGVRNKLPVGLRNSRGDVTSQESQISPRNKPFQTSAHSSDKIDTKTNNIMTVNGAMKGTRGGIRPISDGSDGRAILSKSSATKFTGEGYKLGKGDQGSSFLSQMRKTWQQKSVSTGSTSSRESSHGSTESRLFQLSHIEQGGAASSLSNKKRTSLEAFGTRVNNLDSNKNAKVDNEMSSSSRSNVRHTMLNEPLNEVNRAEASQTVGKVPCPVCNVSVLENSINAHLDLCLLAC